MNAWSRTNRGQRANTFGEKADLLAESQLLFSCQNIPHSLIRDLEIGGLVQLVEPTLPRENSTHLHDD